MKSLTPQTQAQCAARYNEPVLLFEVDWSDVLIGRYAERAVSVDGTPYLGIVRGISRIASSFREPASEYQPVTLKLAPEESLLHQISATVPEGRTARLKLHFEGLGAADAVALFDGCIEKAALDDQHITLVIGPLFKKYDMPLPKAVLAPDDFPQAHPDDIGKPLPYAFGSIPRLPTLRVRTGRTTCLRGSVLASDTTIEVDDTAGFPDSGTLLIEDEQIMYAGRTSDVFTGCTRGANGTVPAEHLNRSEALEYMVEHVYLVAGHACKQVSDVRVAGVPVSPGACTVSRNNTSLLPGGALTTLTFTNRPKVRRYSRASRFLEMQFDQTATGNEALNPEYCYDTSLEGFATLVAKISGAAANDSLRIKQTTDMSSSADSRGEILKAFLLVEHFESKAFTDDYLSASIAGQTFRLAKPSEEDLAGGNGEVDIDHGHSHSITGEHTHSMTVKKEALFTNVVVQTGGTTGGWTELNEIAGSNLNKSGFTATSDTDRSLLCSLAATTSKGSVQRIQFCCRRGESGMAGSFVLRFYLNGSMQKQYTVSGSSSPETWKSDWETISGLNWSDLDNANTYITITPLGTGLIRLFGVWYELEYLEQPADYEGPGTKDDEDVGAYAASNHHVINEEPISSTSVVEGVDITDLVANDWSWFTGREVSVNYNVVGANDGVTGYILHVFFDVEYAPFEEITSDEVTCAVEGIETGGDGTGALIENPSDVIRHMLTAMLGFDEATRIDSASFAAARASLEAAGARFAFLLETQKEASRILFPLAEQARCRLAFDSGKFRLAYRPSALGEPVRIISPASVVAGSTRLAHAGAAAIGNSFIGYCSRDYTRRGSLSDRYAGLVRAADASSQAQYGVRSKMLELWALRDEAYAQQLLDFMLAGSSQPRRRYQWRAFLRDIDLERGDVVEVSEPAKGLLRVKGEVIEGGLIPGGGTPRELDHVNLTADLEAYEFYWIAAGGTYIRLVGGNFYFVLRGELVARLAADGRMFVKGFVTGDQELPAAASHPISYDATRATIAFALSDGTRVMELNAAGNVLLAADVATDQSLAFGGTADAIECDAQKVWFNIGSIRAAEATAEGYLRLPGDVVEDCGWKEVLG